MPAVMAEDSHRFEAHFRPLMRPTRARLIAAVVIGPVTWFAALIAVALVVRRADMIELGLVIAFGSVLVAFLILALIRTRRVREEREHADGS